MVQFGNIAAISDYAKGRKTWYGLHIVYVGGGDWFAFESVYQLCETDLPRFQN